MDDPHGASDGSDALGTFEVGHLTPQQRRDLSDVLADAGILHAFLGPQLQAPASEAMAIHRSIAGIASGAIRARDPRSKPPDGFRWDDPTTPSAPSGPEGLPGPGDPSASPDPAGPGAGGAGDEDLGLDVDLDAELAALWAEEMGQLVISSRWRRLGAYLLETFAFSIITISLLAVSRTAAQAFATGIGLLSAVVLVATIGSTAGMWLLRMRVVVPPSTSAPGWRIAIIRYLVAWWPALVLLVLHRGFPNLDLRWLDVVANVWMFACFGPILFDPLRRGLHDRVAGTLVVDNPR